MPTLESARSWYPSSDPVHGYDHVRRVYRLAEHIAACEGADLEIVLAAVLMHDAQGIPPDGKEAEDGLGKDLRRRQHHQLSADFAAEILRMESWPHERVLAVQHCIISHRFREHSQQPRTLEAQVLYDADKLDAIGAVGIARALAFALQAGEPVYAAPSEQFTQSGRLEPDEPHSAYHEYLFKLRRLSASLFTATGKSLAQERHRLLQYYFENLAAEMEFTPDRDALP